MTVPSILERNNAPPRRPSLLSINAYHYHRGGADNVYLGHGELFAAHGWDSSWSSMHYPLNEPTADSQWFAAMVDMTVPKPLSKRLVEAKRIIWSREAQLKLRGLLATREIDVAHVHSVYHHQSPSVLAELKRHGIPVVLTAHDLKLACPAYTMLAHGRPCERCRGGKVWNVLANKCIKDNLAASALIMIESAVHKALRVYDRFTDRIITPSAFYRDKLIEWGWKPEKIVHVRNFVAIAPNPPPFTAGDHLLYFGRLSHEKGLTTLIRAAAASGVPVRIAGRGPEEERLHALARETGAPVEFLGFRSGDDLWAEVDAARAIVLPSEWYENGPMSAIEALGRGKPLLGAAIGGIPELIAEGVTGWTFRSGDVDDLAGAMTQVMALTPETLTEMHRETHARALADYSAEIYYTTMRDIYRPLIAARGGLGKAPSLP